MNVNERGALQNPSVFAGLNWRAPLVGADRYLGIAPLTNQGGVEKLYNAKTHPGPSQEGIFLSLISPVVPLLRRG